MVVATRDAQKHTLGDTKMQYRMLQHIGN